MSTSEHSAVTFIRNHGKEILEQERYKYEPIKKQDSTDPTDTPIKKDENFKDRNIHITDSTKLELEILY